MRIVIGFPAKELWPNARPHWAVKHRATQKAKAEAYWLAKSANPPLIGEGPIPIRITVYPKRYGPVPDADNVVASVKASLDGIAQALGIDDRHFAAPEVAIGPERSAKIVIEVGELGRVAA